ncbi:FAD-dependent oxidoreductase [Haloarchaeobius sp. HME9146]|uniref:FAD-dependent oxidoreductase n=1 Tax=Haloarchaeobius sp. HME9146 TaxID=2978732 RepID=UPI0021C22A7A|nr:FAD-dependent oxidoreductase [Haloarchaeobius sp. HME9146]MCT9095988.1 FAD-dependent oxidoreductase [Haloarchaeobius sp. HME9146]
MDETAVAVRDVRTVGPDTVALDLETPDGFDALPGQFVLLRAEVDGEELSRYYTLSSPTVGETFEITVGVDPDGDLTPWLADLDEGTEVRIEGPFGNVSYDDAGDVVVVAGGPGIGPAIAIAERAVEHGHEATVVYQDDEPAHEDRLVELEDSGALVQVFDDDADAEVGDAVVAASDRGELYVFGFQDFCELVQDALEEAGLDPDEAHVESFG